MGLLLLVIVLVLTLILVLKTQTESTCNSPTCLEQARKIKGYLRTDVDPCEDFYEFSCGKILNNAHSESLLSVQKQREQTLIQIYKEPINEVDNAFSAAKKLFQVCMNETQIKQDGLHTIKRIIKALGGWPLIEGRKWKKRSVDWLETTYKLRKLGYDYSIFFKLDVVPHWNDSTKYVLRLQPPDIFTRNWKTFSNIHFISKVAEMFGLKDPDKHYGEMLFIQDFILNLQMYAVSTMDLPNQISTIEEFQALHPSFNWLDYINNITLSIPIYKDDYVIFPPLCFVKDWLDFLSETPKRTLANYMIWKVIQELFLYLPKDIRELIPTPNISREEFCIQEVENRFIPSPAEVLYVKRHFSRENKDHLEEILEGIKSDLVDTLEKADWLKNDVKELVAQRAKEVELFFGIFGNDNILDHLKMDLVSTTGDTFLELIGQTTRNRQTILFSNVRKNASQTLWERWSLKSSIESLLYVARDNLIYVSTFGLENTLFSNEMPRYLTYGMFGFPLGAVLLHMINNYNGINDTVKWLNESTVLMGSTNLYQGLLNSSSDNWFKILVIMSESIGEQIVYKAYQRWSEKNPLEYKLPGLDYTPKQLFWISAAIEVCQNNVQEESDRRNFLRNWGSSYKRDIFEFTKDFSCEAG